MINKLLKFFLDLFFPKKCLGCNVPNVYICEKCLDKIEKNNQQQKLPYLNHLTWAVSYSNPLIKEAIKLFKYHYIKELSHPLAQLILKSPAQCVELSSTHNTLIIPIPLHKKRLKERGFNQAELLAKEISKHLSIPLEVNILKRKKHILSQVKIQECKTRRKNIKNNFEIDPEFIKKCTYENKNLLRNKIVFLVDDVATTGATLSEAAKILKRAGVKEVFGLVIAKGK